MTVKEILAKRGELEVCEERSISDEYGELVFYKRQLGEWSNMLADVLGAAFKPAGVDPDKESQLLTGEYGGIYKNQTLFKKEIDGVVVIAMFWPWQDDTHVTLKIAFIKK